MAYQEVREHLAILFPAISRSGLPHAVWCQDSEDSYTSGLSRGMRLHNYEFICFVWREEYKEN
jgi:hypothetical protein